MKTGIAIGYRRAIYNALILQVILGGVAMTFTDGGRLAHTTGIAVLAFWAGAALVMLRRPKTLTPFDLFLIRFGFPMLLILTLGLAEWIWGWHWVWKMRGA